MSVDEPGVSIVIPVHNGERFIARTLASAVAQTYDNLEVIVVDDGSTDGTATIVEAAMARNKRIRLFQMKKSGVAAARNYGISQAGKKLIAPLDADDLWHPEKITLQVKRLQTSSPEVGLVYCWSIAIDENDIIMPPITGLSRKSTAQGRVTVELAKGNFLENSSSALIRRSCIEAVGGYDIDLQPHGAEDWKLYLALSEICGFAVVPEYLVGYRESTGSLSKNVAGMAQSIELVGRWLIQKWPDLPEHIRRKREYGTYIYLARLALDNREFKSSFEYFKAGCQANPAGLLKSSNLVFGIRFLARVAGLSRTVLQECGLSTKVTFKEFQATRHTQLDF